VSELVDPTYINSMSIEQLRRELIFELEKSFALREAFQKLPDVPRIEALVALSEWATWPRDWEKGKEMQRTHSVDVIPPNTEYEKGAGLWSILRTALIAATPATSTPPTSPDAEGTEV